MKLEKYEDKNNKKRKIILISISVIVLISVSFLLYKTFASFAESAEFQVMKGQVDYFGNSDIYFVFYKNKELIEEMPQKDNKENLVFDYGECDNGASIIWDNDDWSPLVNNLSKSKTKCSLYFVSTIELGKDILSTDIGDGLYKVEHNDLTELSNEWSQIEYRYAGANPNNYVRFNNEIWRIIGLVNVKNSNGNIEQRLKIVRTEGIINQKNFGKFSFDYKLEGVGSSITDHGSNDWTDSQIKDMLNGIYYESKSGDCYQGSSVANQCDFTGKGTLPKGLDETARNMIDDEVIWNLGGHTDSYLTANLIYEKERGTTVWEGHKTEWSKETDVGEKHNGIGLMYPSDYGYAVGGTVRNECLLKNLYDYNGDNCASNDWLTMHDFQWTLFPKTTYSLSISMIYDDGRLSTGSTVTDSVLILPSTYLKPSIKIIKNPNPEQEYGSIDNPFILK